MLLLPFTLIFSLRYALLVQAGSQKHGQNCTLTHNRLQTGTFAFYSDCDSKTYCNSSQLCDLKQCRKDLYPFGYDKDDTHLPTLCGPGRFCPDEGGASCMDQLPVGSPCQLNRDDQCAPPDNFTAFADTSKHGLNVNGSVCLNNICMYANVAIGSTCVVENTAYVGYFNGQEFVDIVSRGNCLSGGYCDAQTLKCIQTKDLGATCDGDKECTSYNCGEDGTCGIAAEAPHQFPTYVYILVAAGIFIAMFGTLLGLFIVHRRQRDDEREKRLQYWREQNAFRQNIMQMRETARQSLQSLPRDHTGTGGGSGSNSQRSSVYYGPQDDASFPPQPKASGLRQYFDDTEYEDTPVVQQRPDGRF